MGQVIAHVHHQRIQQEAGITYHQHEQHQHNGQQHVELGETADALVHAGGGGDRREQHNEDRQHRLRHRALGNAEHIVQAEVKLDDADAQAGGHPEHGAQHRSDVHGITDGAVNAFPEDGIQRRSNGQRQAMAITEISQ